MRLKGAEVRVCGVVGQLRQVLANLVSNSIDALPGGGNIHLIAKASGDATTISVEDEGTGMSETVQKQLFQPFFTTKGDRGHGLGLYISQEIMERHRGKLVVESTLGRGTRATWCFPSVTVNKLPMNSDVERRRTWTGPISECRNA